MGDILIKGLEMPANCNDCKFGMWDDYEQAYVCDAVNPFGSIVFFDGFKSDLVSVVKSKRADNCPLIPLPEKYGRLGDLDRLENNLRNMAKYQSGDRQQGILGCCGTIHVTPTIIPASKEDKQ